MPRRFPKEWLAHARNPFPRFKESWYPLYVWEHLEEFGFTSLEGPFDVGADFKGGFVVGRTYRPNPPNPRAV